MPIDIEGWIEVKNQEARGWNGVADISPYLIFAGVDSDYVFGITKIPIGNSIAADRGLPEDISPEARATLDSWREFEKEESNFSFEEIFGFSYISYLEIQRMNLDEKVKNNCGWRRKKEKMKSMSNDCTKPENIRVVVWAIW